MSVPSLIIDNRLVWIAVPKKGNPGVWEPGKVYSIGDTVIPTSNTTVPPGSEDIMFQVVSYCGKTGSIAPVFPSVDKDSVIDGQVIFTCRPKLADPSPLLDNEFYTIDRKIQVS